MSWIQDSVRKRLPPPVLLLLFLLLDVWSRWPTIIHPERTRALVTEGCYRFSRNPVYLGFVGLHASIALLLGSLTGLLVTPLLVLLLVCQFDTDNGPMAIVLVGAMIVSSIHTVWHGPVCPYKGQIQTDATDGVAMRLKKGRS